MIPAVELPKYAKYFELSPKVTKEVVAHAVTAELHNRNIDSVFRLLEICPQCYTMLDWQYLAAVLTFVGKLERFCSVTHSISPIQKWVAENLVNGAKPKKGQTADSLIPEFYHSFIGIFDLSQPVLHKLLSTKGLLHKSFAAGVLLECIPKEDVASLFAADLHLREIIDRFWSFRSIDIVPFLKPLDSSAVVKSVIFVNGGSMIPKVEGMLLKELIVGMDCEWRPEPPFKPAVLQLVTENCAILVDLLAIGNDERFQRMIGGLFEEKGIIKVGHGFLFHDLKNLRTNYPVECYRNLARYYDIIDLHKKLVPDSAKESLQYLAARYLSY